MVVLGFLEALVAFREHIVPRSTIVGSQLIFGSLVHISDYSPD